ncbi:hypothetical protein RRG08_017125, partial [Elysia crispata]
DEAERQGQGLPSECRQKHYFTFDVGVTNPTAAAAKPSK